MKKQPNHHFIISFWFWCFSIISGVPQGCLFGPLWLVTSVCPSQVPFRGSFEGVRDVTSGEMELLYQIPQSPDTRRGFPPSMKKLPNLHLIFTPYSDAFRMFQTLLEFLRVIWSDPSDFWPPSRTQVRILRVSGTLLPLCLPPQSLDNRWVFPPSMKKPSSHHLILFPATPRAFNQFWNSSGSSVQTPLNCDLQVGLLLELRVYLREFEGIWVVTASLFGS